MKETGIRKKRQGDGKREIVRMKETERDGERDREKKRETEIR